MKILKLKKITLLKDTLVTVNSYSAILMIVFILLSVSSTKSLLYGQNIVNLPDCTNCAASPSSISNPSPLSSVKSNWGLFPYKVEQVTGNSEGTSALRTENGVVFAWGWNGAGYSGTTPIINYNTRTNTIGVPSPIRISLPTGVKATDIAVGGGNIMAIGDNGKLYGAGSTGSLWGTGAYAGTFVNNTSFTEIPLPPSSTSAVKVIAAVQYYSSTIIIDNNGRAWFTGQDPNDAPDDNIAGFVRNNTFTWSEIKTADPTITFTNAWVFGMGQTYYTWNNFVFEGSDGKYYCFGANLHGAFGSAAYASETTTYAYEYHRGFTVTSHSDPLIEMDIPAGVKIVKFDGTYGEYYALSDDGTLYHWSLQHPNPPYVNPATPGIPNEVELPSGGILNVSPTKVTNMCAIGFQCDDGALYSRNIPGYHFLSSNSLHETTNGYDIYLGQQYAYQSIFAAGNYDGIYLMSLLTEEGNLRGWGDGDQHARYFGALQGPERLTAFNAFYFLTDSRADPNNDRPTEDPADDK